MHKDPGSQHWKIAEYSAITVFGSQYIPSLLFGFEIISRCILALLDFELTAFSTGEPKFFLESCPGTPFMKFEKLYRCKPKHEHC